MAAVGIQDDDGESARDNRLEDGDDMMDVFHVKFEFLQRVYVCQINIPGEI